MCSFCFGIILIDGIRRSDVHFHRPVLRPDFYWLLYLTSMFIEAQFNKMQQFFLYIDPGSGSYLVQAIIAAVLGGLFYFKRIWLRIKLFFSSKKKEQDPDNIEQHDSR